MNRDLVRSTIAGLALAVLTACGETTGPDGVAGAYRLQRFEGQPLPAFYMQTGVGVLSVVDEHLILGDDGKGVSTTVYEEVSNATPNGRLIPVTRGLEFVVRGSRVEITFVCPPSASTAASCAAGPHLTGERIGTSLALGRPVSSKPASTYGRVR